MNDSTPRTLKEQLNFEQRYNELVGMLDAQLASWQLTVFQVNEKFIVGEVKGSYIEEISKHPTRLAAYDAALEYIPEILFTIVTNDEDVR